MKQDKITIDGSRVSIEPGRNGEIWLTRGQLADLFGVYYGTITVNIKAVIRSGAVKPSFEGTLVLVGKTVLPERYDMEMVIALAFWLDSPNAECIRRCIARRVVAGTGTPALPIFLSYSMGVVKN